MPRNDISEFARRLIRADSLKVDDELQEVRFVLDATSRYLFEINASGRGTETSRALESRIAALMAQLETGKE